MKDLQKLYLECLKELADIGIVCGNIKSVTVNTRAQNRWGLCKKRTVTDYSSPKPVYECEISISYRLLDDAVSDEATKNTLIHELLHTCEGGHGHKGVWQELANRVNTAYGYNIKRITAYDEKGVEDIRKASVYKYVIACKSCGHEYKRTKQTSIIKTPERYRCGCCGGMLCRIK